MKSNIEAGNCNSVGGITDNCDQVEVKDGDSTEIDNIGTQEGMMKQDQE